MTTKSALCSAGLMPAGMQNAGTPLKMGTALVRKHYLRHPPLPNHGAGGTDNSQNRTLSRVLQ